MFPTISIDRAIKKAVATVIRAISLRSPMKVMVWAVLLLWIEALTDNRNRTAADVRHYFDKFGSGLGQSGCVSFMFEHKGVMVNRR